VSFANPTGALAFAALAVVLAIHLLQRRPRVEVVSTLFLLRPAAARSLGGRRLDRLRRSTSLWLQLAAATLLAWLLMGPRQVAEESVQRVVVVLDSTASMSVFRNRAEEAVARRAASLARRARTTEWVVLESAMRRPALYAGRDRQALGRSLADWDPRHPGHDFGGALDGARALAGPQGVVLFVTDRELEVPEGVERLAVGRPVDNVGFVAGRAEGRTWRAIVKNSGLTAARRRWGLREEAGVRTLGELGLGPGEMRELSAPFPQGREAVQLWIEGDAFSLDDQLPIVTTRRKTLRVAVAPAVAGVPLVARFLATLEAVERVAERAGSDLAIVAQGPERDPVRRGPAIVLLRQPPGPRILPPAAVGGAHALVADLDWTSLVAREAPGFAPRPGDEALLWAGRRALVILDAAPEGDQLLLNFPLEGSSAARVAAVPLLLHRFAETVRARVVGWERANLETGQELSLGLEGSGAALAIEHAQGREGPVAVPRAPLQPGLFRVLKGGHEVLSAAAQFADAAEGDLSAAATLDEGRPRDERVAALRSRDHPLAALGLLAVMGLLVADWTLLPRRP
jgi:hypothetical protein